MDVLLVVSLTQTQVSFHEINIDKMFSLLRVIVATIAIIVVLVEVINIKFMIKVIIIQHTILLLSPSGRLKFKLFFKVSFTQ